MADAESSTGSTQYLESLSGDAAERITAMKWARYLGAAFGPSGALSALRYYDRIGWISEDVRRTMVDYVRGLTIEQLELSEVEPDLHGSLRNLAGTEFERHARSLQFVAAISGRSIEHGLASLQLAESLGPGAGGGQIGVGAGAAGQPPSVGATGGPFVGGDLEPGEHAEMAAGESQRERDRTRRDERAGRAEARGADHADARPDGPAEGTAEASEDGAETVDDGTTDPADDIEVSMADVTPGSVDPEAQSGASSDDERAAATEVDPEVEPVPEPSPSGSTPVADGIDATFEDGNVTSDDDSEGGSQAFDATAETTPADLPADEDPPADENRCIAITRDGDRCARSVIEGGDYCHQHAPEP